MYYGKKFDKAYAQKVLQFLKKMYPLLKKMCGQGEDWRHPAAPECPARPFQVHGDRSEAGAQGNQSHYKIRVKKGQKSGKISHLADAS